MAVQVPVVAVVVLLQLVEDSGWMHVDIEAPGDEEEEEEDNCGVSDGDSNMSTQQVRWKLV